MFPQAISTSQLRENTNLLFDFAGLGTPLYLHHPVRIYRTDHRSAVADLLRQAEQEALAGHWVAGFLTFEAAAAFALPVQAKTTLPLVWLAVFAQAEAVTLPPIQPPPRLPTLHPEIDWTRYQRDMQTILGHIGAGESYQVNYTLAARLAGETDPAALFLALQAAHRHPYAAWLQCDAVTVASFSPELFLQRTGDRLWTAPIKGTCARLADPDADEALGRLLEQSAKDRAEHLMIVDMARNDLGRVCRIGTVQVDHLFERRLFTTVQHLETRVQGQQLPGLTWDQLLAALFPAASITGAPKQRTMEIIQALEGRPRGIYSGSLVIMRPGGDFISNVAIRTLTWQGQEAGRIGLGGGIVADSDSHQEWAEIADKGRFLREIPDPLHLIETILVDQAGTMPRLARHMARLHHSACCLGLTCDGAQIEAAIRRQAAEWHQENPAPCVVRVLLNPSGAVTLQRRPVPVVPPTLTVRLATQGVDRWDLLLRHKTTRRQPFERALALARAAGDQEVLFANVLGHVTEGAIRAVAVCRAGEWWVPPLADGLLASVWRAEMQEQFQAQERSLTVADLVTADEVRMGNAVQGGVPVARLKDAAGRVLAEWG